MANQQLPPAPRTVWAYAYQIVPPQPEGRLQGLRTLLDHERTDAQSGARTWEGRLVLEQQVTHILIVSDSPDLALEANRRLETELRRLKAGFAITAPLTASDGTALAAGTREPPGADQTGPTP